MPGHRLGVGHASGRVSVGAVSDDEAVATRHGFARREGIIPAPECAHALTHAVRLAGRRPAAERILVDLLADQRSG